MSEMALTAEHLIVVGRGRLIADTTVEEIIRGASANAVAGAQPGRRAAARRARRPRRHGLQHRGRRAGGHRPDRRADRRRRPRPRRRPARAHPAAGLPGGGLHDHDRATTSSTTATSPPRRPSREGRARMTAPTATGRRRARAPRQRVTPARGRGPSGSSCVSLRSSWITFAAAVVAVIGLGALICLRDQQPLVADAARGAARLRPGRPQPRRRQPGPAGHRRPRRAGRHRRVRHRDDPLEPHGGAPAAAGARRQGRRVRRRRPSCSCWSRRSSPSCSASRCSARHGTTLGAPHALRAVIGVALYLTVVGAVRRRPGLHRCGTPPAASPRCSGCCWCCPASAGCCPTTWQPHVAALPAQQRRGARVRGAHRPGHARHVDGLRGVLRLGGGRPGARRLVLSGATPAPP